MAFLPCLVAFACQWWMERGEWLSEPVFSSPQRVGILEAEAGVGWESCNMREAKGDCCVSFLVLHVYALYSVSKIKRLLSACLSEVGAGL